MQAYQRPVLSNPTTQFIEALAQNAISANYDIPLPTRDPCWFVRSLSIVAVQNLSYELWLFARAANLGGTIATDYFVGVWQFGPLVAGDPGWTVGADPLFHYYIDGTMIPYLDRDMMSPATMVGAPLGPAMPGPASLHVRLVNRSATGKNAGPTGALQVTFNISAPGVNG